MTDSLPGFRPLYQQVRSILVKRIAEGIWQPGQVLPSEPELAADLGVSPGTVRKALDEMTAESLVIRRQGRGTFVARHDDAQILFQFFKLAPDTGERQLPESRLIGVRSGCNDGAAERLGIPLNEGILMIDRTRQLGGHCCVFERICLPVALFPDLEKRDIPNNLYGLFAASYGVTIGRASEQLKAVSATSVHAQHLGVEKGHPLLQVDRLAFSLDGRRVEWRLSVCRTDMIHYASDLR